MSDDDIISRPSRLDGVRRVLQWEIVPRRSQAPERFPRRGTRANVKRRIDEAALPEPARELVRRVVRRTRLWQRERLGVADELIAHFTDGLAAGETAEQLVEAFGDERRAARLIRRAKRRNRPLAWHALRGLGLMIAALVVLYVGLGVYFHTGRPSPSVDYVAVLNEPLRQVPEDQRAWPLYREALLGMFTRDPETQERQDAEHMLRSRPGEEWWPKMAEWVAARSDALELARRAADRPTLGFVLGPGGSHVDPALWPGQTRGASPWPGQDDAKQTPLLLAVLLPHLNELRVVAMALGADAVLARQAGDRDRWCRDVVAMRGIARQLRGGGFLVTHLVALGIDGLALEEIQAGLSETPQLFGDGDLTRLAHELAGPDVASDLFDFRAERMTFHDVVQRAYTDDGDGDGRLTPEGLRLLVDFSAFGRPEQDFREPAALAGGPASLLLVAPRAEVLRVYDRLMDVQEARYTRPLRALEQPTIGREIGAMGATAAGRARYAPILALMPSLERAQVQAERYLGRRDGILAGLALELHRRRHGRYPDTLNELAPELLPRVPVDRITGAPVRYKLVGGKPLIYSLGADRDDDGGVVTPPGVPARYADFNAEWILPPAGSALAKPGTAPAGGAAATSPSSPAPKIPDGDWLLYPQPPADKPQPPRQPATQPAEQQ